MHENGSDRISDSGKVAPTGSVGVHEVYQRHIKTADLLRTAAGVVAAIKMDDAASFSLRSFLKNPQRTTLHSPVARPQHENDPLEAASIVQWLAWIAIWPGLNDISNPCSFTSMQVESEALRDVAKHCLGICILRQTAHDQLAGDQLAASVAVAWDFIRHAIVTSLVCPSLDFQLSRSHNGYDKVSLCTIMNGGEIEESFQLQVWLPDCNFVESELSICSSQAFYHSWTLLGRATSTKYTIEECTGSTFASHAEYQVHWHNSRNQDNAYRKHPTSTTLVNTGRLVQIVNMASQAQTKGAIHTMPQGIFHTIKPPERTFFAALTFVDASKGWERNAKALGSLDGTIYRHNRRSTAASLMDLMSWIGIFLRWEHLMVVAKESIRLGKWEQALQVFDAILNICETSANLPAKDHYRRLVLVGIASVYRQSGFFQRARELLEGQIDQLPPGPEQVDALGELATVSQHTGQLKQAKNLYQKQYDIAKLTSLKDQLCIAAGCLGVVCYQLSRALKDRSLLLLAVDHLQERIDRSKSMAKEALQDRVNWSTRTRQIQLARMCESYGLSRLSLCYTALGQNQAALITSQAALELIHDDSNPVQVGVSRYFYGRALLLAGRKREALDVFNTHDACPPAVALCRHRSAERLEFLQQIVDHGTNLLLTDQHDYDALDYTIINGDQAAEKILLAGLRKRYTSQTGAVDKVQLHHMQSLTRKGYREIFQDKMRPALHASLLSWDHTAVLHKVRLTYAASLEDDSHLKAIFDGLKYVQYTDFINHGELPRSTDGITRSFQTATTSAPTVGYIIFFSYCWLYNDLGTGVSGPKSANTQYVRMLDALQQFLAQHRDIDPQSLGIWVDCACIDQSNPAPGVAALPMLLAQCDAVISLVDEHYYNRAWCSVEVILIQTLRRAYQLHEWYEHVAPETHDGEQRRLTRWVLRDGPQDKVVKVKGKELTFEHDRLKIAFLERQSRLLGQFQPV